MVNTPSNGNQERVTAAISALLCRYSGEWEKTVHRLGRWIDFENDYKTLDPTFMESVWWAFSELYAKGLVYRGFKARPACSTCRSYCDQQAEAAQLLCPLLATEKCCCMQVMPYSTACSTTLSNFEAGQNYKDVDDPAVTVIQRGGSTCMAAVMGNFALVAGMHVRPLLQLCFRLVSV